MEHLTITGLSCDAGPSGSCQSEKIDRGAAIWMHRGNGDNHQIDGSGRNEFLQLAFNVDIALRSLTFTYANEKDDEFDLYTRSGGTWSQLLNGADPCVSNCGNRNTPHTFDVPIAYEGGLFMVGASGDKDDWKLRSVSVVYDPAPPPAPIPLPAAGWMLLAGLGGIAAVGRRRRKA